MTYDGKSRREFLVTGSAAATTAITGFTGNGAGENVTGGVKGKTQGNTLNVLTWAGYGGVAKMLEKQSNANVNIKLISSDVQGFNTLKGGGVNQFDVLLLDNTWAQRNARADTIKPLKKKDYPSRNDWLEQLQWPYETFVYENKMWAVPPRWGWGGMGYDEREVDLAELEERGYEIVWNGDYKVTLADWPTWVIPLVVMQLFDLDGKNPMDVELSDSQLKEVENTLVKMFNNAVAVHTGAAAMRQDMLQGNAQIVFGAGNFAVSQLPAEGHRWMKEMVPPDVGGWYWVEGLCLVNNPNLNRELAIDFHNTCLTPEGQYSICWKDAKSKGAPVNTKAYDKFSKQQQKDIMMWKDQGFEATDTLLDQLVQYKISPQQDRWLEMWSRAKAKSNI